MKMNHLEGAQFIGWRVKHHGQDPDSSLVVSRPPRKRRLGTSQKGRINTGHPPQRQGLHRHLKATQATQAVAYGKCLLAARTKFRRSFVS